MVDTNPRGNPNGNIHPPMCPLCVCGSEREREIDRGGPLKLQLSWTINRRERERRTEEKFSDRESVKVEGPVERRLSRMMAVQSLVDGTGQRNCVWIDRLYVVQIRIQLPITTEDSVCRRRHSCWPCSGHSSKEQVIVCSEGPCVCVCRFVYGMCDVTSFFLVCGRYCEKSQRNQVIRDKYNSRRGRRL